MSEAALIWGKVAPVALRLMPRYLERHQSLVGEKVGRTSIVLQVVRVFPRTGSQSVIFKSGGKLYIGHALVALNCCRETVETIVRY
jgi:hypothetical protein